MTAEVRNKVQDSGLLIIDLEDFYPQEQIIFLDISVFLTEGLLLKEKDFREKIDQLNKNQLNNKIIGLYCKTDAIIPFWAYLLFQIKLLTFQNVVFLGNTLEKAVEYYYTNWIQNLDLQIYMGQKVILKGCGKKNISLNTYMHFIERISPVVCSVRIGEACSSVPLLKK
jgi:hypothetical protein